jgi:hypothetical protein
VGRSHFPFGGLDDELERASRSQYGVCQSGAGVGGQGKIEVARGFYMIAAEAEVLALGDLEADKLRTLGITVVSAVALWFKAGSWGRRRCWLMSGWLVGW